MRSVSEYVLVLANYSLVDIVSNLSTRPPIFSDDVYSHSVCLRVPVSICVHVCLGVQSVAAISWVPLVTPDVTNIPANVAANATSPVDSATNAWRVPLLTYLIFLLLVG